MYEATEFSGRLGTTQICDLYGSSKNDEALVRLMESMGDALLSYARRLVGDSFTAEEVCQDTFIKLWRHMDNLQFDSQLRAWLYTVTRTTALDALRKRRQSTAICMDEDFRDHSPGPDREFERKLFSSALHDALARLPEHYASVLSLRLMEGFSYKDIADYLDLPLGTVKSRLRNGMGHLSRELLAAGFNRSSLS